MIKSCIYDFSNFALERPGLRMVRAIVVASGYALYHFVMVNPLLWGQILSGSFFWIFLLANAKDLMLRGLSIASINILPGGESVRIVTFKGSVHEVLIKDLEVYKVRKASIELIYRTNEFGPLKK